MNANKGAKSQDTWNMSYSREIHGYISQLVTLKTFLRPLIDTPMDRSGSSSTSEFVTSLSSSPVTNNVFVS